MTEPNVRSAPDALQFDRATGTGHEQQTDAAGVTCARCKTAITTQYYNVNGVNVCASCKEAVMQASTAQNSSGAFVRAALFGFGAAVAGAAIYYGVIALANLEIGVVAILIGYMVGAAIQKGARGGGRRYQILAIALTYFSVGLAYSPLAFKGVMERRTTESTAAARRRQDSVAAALGRNEVRKTDSAAAATPARDGTASPANAVPDSTSGMQISTGDAFMGLAIALGATFVLVFALPVMVVAGSMPSGLISALIIVIGMRQAWRMTAGHVFKVTGPHKVGGAAASSA